MEIVNAKDVAASFVAAATSALSTKERRGAGGCEADGWRFEAMVRRPSGEELAKEIPQSPYFWGIRFQIVHRVDLLAPIQRGTHTQETVEDGAKAFLWACWRVAEAMTVPAHDLKAPLAAWNKARYWWAPETWRKDMVDQAFKKVGRFMQMHWCIMGFDPPKTVYIDLGK